MLPASHEKHLALPRCWTLLLQIDLPCQAKKRSWLCEVETNGFLVVILFIHKMNEVQTCKTDECKMDSQVCRWGWLTRRLCNKKQIIKLSPGPPHLHKHQQCYLWTHSLSAAAGLWSSCLRQQLHLLFLLCSGPALSGPAASSPSPPHVCLGERKASRVHWLL